MSGPDVIFGGLRKRLKLDLWEILGKICLVDLNRNCHNYIGIIKRRILGIFRKL